MIYTNINSFVEALETNFKGVSNKKYIRDSLERHFKEKYITKEEYNYLCKKYLK